MKPALVVSAIRRAAEILRRGGLVVFPTETVYGLGADALDPAAVRAVFALKGRPSDNPLIVHVFDLAALERVAVANPRAWCLARRFWPGPLTFVLPRRPCVPDETTAALETVAVRAPAHPVARALLARVGRPIAAPSANRSGRPSPTRPEHVRSDFGQDAPYILDGGACPVGVESTVLDISGERPILLRPGGVGRAAIEQVLGEPVLVPERSAEGPVRSPGMKYRHYAPDVPLILIEGPPESVIDRMEVLARRERAAARRIGWLLSTEGAEAVRSSPGEVREVLGPRDEPRAQAARLFDALRRLEEAGVDVILAEGSTSPGGGVEAAVIDRLRRASARVERVGGAWR